MPVDLVDAKCLFFLSMDLHFYLHYSVDKLFNYKNWSMNVGSRALLEKLQNRSIR